MHADTSHGSRLPPSLDVRAVNGALRETDMDSKRERGTDDREDHHPAGSRDGRGRAEDDEATSVVPRPSSPPVHLFILSDNVISSRLLRTPLRLYHASAF
jgi:hypothetical protein